LGDSLVATREHEALAAVVAFTMPLAIAIGVQEMVFAVWLLVKGLGPSPQLPTTSSDRPSTAPAVLTS
jgi:hypothetical protein